MKAGEVGGSLLMSALNACRARLKAFIRGRMSVRDDADDILQEVTYQLMKVEQPVENVAAWLFRAARNEMTDRARKKREVSLSGYFTDEEEEGFPEDELAETLFGVPQTPEEEYLKSFEKFTTLIQQGGALVMKHNIKLSPKVAEGVKVYTYSEDKGDFHAKNIKIGLCCMLHTPLIFILF